MDLSVEHNLTRAELSDTLVALAKSHGLEFEIHECLSKAVDIEAREPSDPFMAGLLRQFRHEYAKAIAWISQMVENVFAEGVPRTSFALFKAKPTPREFGTPLTKEEIRYIQDAIRERFNFICKNMEAGFTPNEKVLKKWKVLGIIDAGVTAQDFVSMSASGKLLKNAFVFGRFQLAVERGGKNFAEILQIALGAPLTKPDQYAIEAAERSAAQYITKFGEDIAGEAGRLIDNKNRQIVHDMVVAVPKQELQAIKLREGAPDRLVTNWRQLSSELYHTMGDRARDWNRIAFYELENVKHEGEAMRLLNAYGKEQLVYKLPLATACPQCRFLYLDQNNVPRLFKLGVMLGYGNNIGRKPLPVKGGVVVTEERNDGADTLKAVSGLVHPYCECTGPLPATGYEYWYSQAAKPL